MMDVVTQPTREERIQRIHRGAADRFQRAIDWVSFYREILGVNGLVDDLFPSFEDRTAFEASQEYAEIQQMLAKLREKNSQSKEPEESTKVITVRLPQSLHEALRHEAHHFNTSMNKLCISKLLQVIAGELVPSDFERREADRPVRQRSLERPLVESVLMSEERPQGIAPVVPPHPLATSQLSSSDTLGGGRPF